jgi:hypothetical protein
MKYLYSIAPGPATPISGTTAAEFTFGPNPSGSLSGTDTLYLTELHVFDLVCVGHALAEVTQIVSDTSAQVSPLFETVVTSADTYALRSLRSLRVASPRHTFQDYVEPRKLMDGHTRGLGRPLATWLWDFLPLGMRTILRTYCSTPSADVVICTRINEGDAWRVYNAIVTWPPMETKQAGRRMSFSLTFENLVML